jgi:hypothetical protein
MTCVAGIVHDGEVYMASDADMTWGWTKHDCGSKVFSVGDVKFAACGLACVAESIRMRLTLPPVPEGEGGREKWLKVTLPDAIRATLKEVDLLKDGAMRGEGTILIGWRGMLVSMDCHFATYDARRGYVAHGSGGDVAIGVLYATEGQKPKDRLKKAIEAATLWAVGCGGKAFVESV